MNGENIQKARDQLQFMRRHLMSGLRLGDKSFSANPGILANFQFGKRIQERVQNMRRTPNLPPATRTKKEEEKVNIDELDEEIKERFMNV